MYTKSIIQTQIELINSKNQFKKELTELMEHYNVEDNIFVYNGKTIEEIKNGYFEVLIESDNFNEIIKECDIQSNGIRIINSLKNPTYQIGIIHQFINECDSKSHKVFDIHDLNYI